MTENLRGQLAHPHSELPYLACFRYPGTSGAEAATAFPFTKTQGLDQEKIQAAGGAQKPYIRASPGIGASSL